MMLSDDYEDNDVVGFGEFEEYIVSKYKFINNNKSSQHFNVPKRVSKNSSLESNNLDVKKDNFKNSENSSNNKEVVEVKSSQEIYHKNKALAEPNTS